MAHTETSMSTTQTKPKRRRLRLTFSLLSLLILITITAVGIRWWMMPAKITVVATFRIKEPQFIVLDPTSPPMTTDRYDRFRHTQADLVRSRSILGPALRRLNKNKLALLAEQSDPLDFLESTIRGHLIEHTELMEIQMTGTEDTQADCLVIMKEVVEEYFSYMNRYQRNIHRDLIAALQKERDSRDNSLKQLQFEVREREKAIKEGTYANTEGDPDIQFMRQRLAGETEIYHLIEQRIRILQTNQFAPSRVELVDAPGVRRD